MKFFFTTLSLVAILTGCTQKSMSWEYKELKINNINSSSSYGKLSSGEFESTEDQLNVLGKQGWELSATYTLTETVYPNFGNEDYHTGIKPNTRTKTIVYVLKRQKKEEKKQIVG